MKVAVAEYFAGGKVVTEVGLAGEGGSRVECNCCLRQ